jgi:hypothetical protein
MPMSTTTMISGEPPAPAGVPSRPVVRALAWSVRAAKVTITTTGSVLLLGADIQS